MIRLPMVDRLLVNRRRPRGELDLNRGVCWERHILSHAKDSAVHRLDRAQRGEAEAFMKSSSPGIRARRRTAPQTAADAPEPVKKLLKSYDPKALRWRVPGHRYEIVVAVLTRGNDQAKQWLWSVLSLSEVRELVRKYRGAGCAEPDRALLRQQLALTDADIPSRPYLGLGGGTAE